MMKNTTAKAAKVEVDTTCFVRSHGVNPRGRGGWIFCTVHPNRADYLDHLIHANGLYAEARREAVKQAAARNLAVIYLCS